MERGNFSNPQDLLSFIMHQPLPPPDACLKAAYLLLVAEIERCTQSLLKKRWPNGLQCGPGCSSCCIAFSIFPLEAALIGELLTHEQQAEPVDRQVCALLNENLCRIYPARPIICRTQGLPIAYLDTDAECIEVSACPINFPDDCQFLHEDLLFLDQYNSRLAQLNLRYCEAHGLDPQTRIPIHSIIRYNPSS